MNEQEEVMELFKTLCTADIHFFPAKGKVDVSNKHGVYIVYSADNCVLHVGMTPYGKDGLNQRLYNHISKTGVFYREYLRKRNISLRGLCKFRFLEIEEPRTRALVEALAAGLLCPEHFGTGIRRLDKQV